MKNKKLTFNATRYTLHEKAQALVLLISFIAFGVAIITAAILVNIIQATSTTAVEVGSSALSVAEGGVENAMLRLLRNPSYTGETLAVGSGTATVTVTGSGPKTITSVGVLGRFKRTLRVVVVDNSGTLTISSWREI